VIADSSLPDAGSAVCRRVLLADDHPAMLRLTAAALGSEYFVVGSAADGPALLAEAERLNPDVIVLDITMPRLDGIEAARQLRLSHNPARLVFLTVHEDPDPAGLRGWRHGRRDFWRAHRCRNQRSFHEGAGRRDDSRRFNSIRAGKRSHAGQGARRAERNRRPGLEDLALTPGRS